MERLDVSVAFLLVVLALAYFPSPCEASCVVSSRFPICGSSSVAAGPAEGGNASFYRCDQPLFKRPRFLAVEYEAQLQTCGLFVVDGDVRNTQSYVNLSSGYVRTLPQSPIAAGSVTSMATLLVDGRIVRYFTHSASDQITVVDGASVTYLGTAHSPPQLVISGIVADAMTRTLYYTERAGKRIMKYAAATASVVAGTFGQTALKDGTGDAAQFLAPSALTLFYGQTLYIIDAQTVRRLRIVIRNVTTIAGSSSANALPNVDGPCATATFVGLRGIEVDSNGRTLYVLQDDGKIRVIHLQLMVVTTLTTAGDGSAVPQTIAMGKGYFSEFLFVDDGAHVAAIQLSCKWACYPFNATLYRWKQPALVTGGADGTVVVGGSIANLSFATFGSDPSSYTTSSMGLTAIVRDTGAATSRLIDLALTSNGDLLVLGLNVSQFFAFSVGKQGQALQVLQQGDPLSVGYTSIASVMLSASKSNGFFVGGGNGLSQLLASKSILMTFSYKIRPPSAQLSITDLASFPQESDVLYAIVAERYIHRFDVAKMSAAVVAGAALPTVMEDDDAWSGSRGTMQKAVSLSADGRRHVLWLADAGCIRRLDVTSMRLTTVAGYSSVGGAAQDLWSLFSVFGTISRVAYVGNGDGDFLLAVNESDGIHRIAINEQCETCSNIVPTVGANVWQRFPDAKMLFALSNGVSCPYNDTIVVPTLEDAIEVAGFAHTAFVEGYNLCSVLLYPYCVVVDSHGQHTQEAAESCDARMQLGKTPLLCVGEPHSPEEDHRYLSMTTFLKATPRTVSRSISAVYIVSSHSAAPTPPPLRTWYRARLINAEPCNLNNHTLCLRSAVLNCFESNGTALGIEITGAEKWLATVGTQCAVSLSSSPHNATIDSELQRNVTSTVYGDSTKVLVHIQFPARLRLSTMDGTSITLTVGHPCASPSISFVLKIVPTVVLPTIVAKRGVASQPPPQLTRVTQMATAISAIIFNSPSTAVLGWRLTSGDTVSCYNDNDSDDATEDGGTLLDGAHLSSPFLLVPSMQVIVTSAILVGLGAFQWLWAVFYSRTILGSPWFEVWGLPRASPLRFVVDPKRTATLVIYFFGPSIAHAVASTTHYESLGDEAVGVVSLVLLLLVSFRIVHCVTRDFHAEDDGVEYAENNCVVLLVGRDGASGYEPGTGDDDFVQHLRYRAFYEDYAYHCHWFFAVELALMWVDSATYSVLRNVPIYSVGMCTFIKLLPLVSYALYVVLLWWRRPYTLRYRNIICPLIALAIVIHRAAGIMPLKNKSKQNSILAWTASIADGLGLLLSVLDVLLLLWDCCCAKVRQRRRGANDDHQDLLMLSREGSLSGEDNGSGSGEDEQEFTSMPVHESSNDSREFL